jgi:hypothetical protein
VTAGAAGDASAAASPNSAPANRGGGGGGATSATAGNGGSGRVVIRALTADLAPVSISTTGSPATSTNGSYTYWDYTASGTFVVA